MCYNTGMNVRVKSYAKLNLALAVNGSENGYHSIDSIVCSVDVFDLIKLSRRRDGLVTVEMHGRGSESIPFENNNAVKAAEAYIKKFGTRGADIKIYKNIPMGAGMGGSSADAAGVIRGMSKLYGLGSERELKELADLSGSDTGYMLSGGYARISGRGDKVLPIESDLRLDFLILVPKSGVSTAECYAQWDRTKPRGGLCDGVLSAIISGDNQAIGKGLFNDLYLPAAQLNSDVETAFGELESFSPLGVCMTGSGSAVFALFENAAFCDWAKSRYRGKFECFRSKTVNPR